LNVSKIANQLVYGSRPRIPFDKVITYKEMQDYVTRALSIAFGQYIHGLGYGKNKCKFHRFYKSKCGINCKMIAIPDYISPHLITEEKCTFSWNNRNPVGEIQLQLEGYVCRAGKGILKIRHIPDNAVVRRVISLEEPTAISLIEGFIGETLLPYIYDTLVNR
jgi:hypothetical protein